MYYILYGDEIYGYALMVKLTSVATLQNSSGEKDWYRIETPNDFLIFCFK